MSALPGTPGSTGSSASPRRSSEPGRTDMLTRTQRLTLVLLVGAGFMGSVDFSILNVALPEAGDGVGMGTAGLPWITAAYTLPVAGGTLLLGRAADLYGRRRLFMAGMVVLLVGSFVGGLAATPEMLLAGRALQGIATAMSIPAGLSLLTTTFGEGPLRDRVLGINGALLSGGFSVGALVVGALILVATPLLIRESAVPRGARLDLPGAVTVSGGLLAVTYAVIETDLVA